MATEYEWKFGATPDILSAIDMAFPGSGTKITMETTYYDTPSGSLSARKYTLRKRLENGVGVCTLKVPAGNARGEWEIRCEEIENAVPQMVALGCPQELSLLVQEGLNPVCGASFTRIAKEITLQDGIVELALDKGVLFGGEREAPLCEVEVELKQGGETFCDAFARALAKEFRLQKELRSKFRRALALYKGE